MYGNKFSHLKDIVKKNGILYPFQLISTDFKISLKTRFILCTLSNFLFLGFKHETHNCTMLLIMIVKSSCCILILKLNYRKKVFLFALNFLPWEFLLIKVGNRKN